MFEAVRNAAFLDLQTAYCSMFFWLRLGLENMDQTLPVVEALHLLQKQEKVVLCGDLFAECTCTQTKKAS